MEEVKTGSSDKYKLFKQKEYYEGYKDIYYLFIKKEEIIKEGNNINNYIHILDDIYLSIT